MASTKPRRHSVVTLRLTVTPDEVFSEDFRRDSSVSPTVGMRNRALQRSRHGRQATSPLCRTPTSPLCWSPSSNISRSPTSPRPRTPTTSRPASPHSPTLPLRRESSSPLPSGRNIPSPISPRSNRLFRYDSAIDQKNLRRRSSLLTVPSAHEPPVAEHVYRTPRQRSSSIAGPIRPPDLIRYLNETALPERTLKPTNSSSSVASNEATDNTSPSLSRKPIPLSPEQSTTSLYSPIKRRHSYFADSTATGQCRLRQFSTTSRGSIVNKGDSIRPKRSASNTSVTSTMSSTSRERALSQDSITPIPTPSGSKATTPVSSRCVTPSPTPNTTPQYHVAMIGSEGVGRRSLVTQFMTSEYKSAYEDCTDESGSERSVSVILDGEEAELLFIRIPDIKAKSSGSPEASLDESVPLTLNPQVNVDAWVIVYSIADRASYREAATALGRLWSKSWAPTKAIILVGNKTDLARSRAVSMTEGRTLARTYECKFIEVSAGIDHNVDELLVGILAQIRLKLKARKPTETCRSTCRRMSEKLKPKNSFRMKGFLGKMISKGKRSRSCENLHML